MRSYTFLILMLVSLKAVGEEYKCSINLLPPGLDVSKSEFKKYIKQFSYQKKEAAPGKTSTLKDVSVFIWAKENKIHLAIQKKMKKADPLKFQTSYPFETSDIKVKISPDIEVRCLGQKALAAIKDENVKKLVDTSINDKSDLYSYGTDVFFVNTTFLKFKYNQRNVSGMMRPVVFQKGKVLTMDDDYDQNVNWCVFNIEVKLNEDTFIQGNTRLKPVSVSKNSNNDTQTVYSYNFVDFSSGKKSFDTNRYSPFSFECSLGKDQGFKSEVIKEVTGGRIKVIPSL